jgi:uncharacterized membrane protein HdeD (DUF308 family)
MMSDDTYESWGPGDTAGQLARSAPGIIGFGVVSVVAGILVLVWPGATLTVVAVIFGLALLVGGIFRIVTAFSAQEIRGGGRVLLALLGIISILVGILCLRHPFQTIGVLVVLLGLYWVVAGVLEIVHAAGAHEMHSRGWAIGAGVLSVVAGIVLLAFTAASALVLVWLVGLELVVYGGITVGRGVQLRQRAHRAEVRAGHRPAHP